MTQMVESPPTMQETWVQCLDWEESQVPAGDAPEPWLIGLLQVEREWAGEGRCPREQLV